MSSLYDFQFAQLIIPYPGLTSCSRISPFCIGRNSSLRFRDSSVPGTSSPPSPALRCPCECVLTVTANPFKSLFVDCTRVSNKNTCLVSVAPGCGQLLSFVTALLSGSTSPQSAERPARFSPPLRRRGRMRLSAHRWRRREVSVAIIAQRRRAPAR